MSRKSAASRPVQHTFMQPYSVQPPASENESKTSTSEIAVRLFLVGCPRSGTTLLQSLLSAHPRVYSVPESHLYTELLSKNRVWRRLGFARRDAPERFEKLLASLGLPTTYLRSPVVRTYLLHLARELDRAALANSKTVWLEKTPRHLYYVPNIARALPGAKFIHLLRDGQDVVASLYDVTHTYPAAWGGARSIDSCVQRWVKDTELSLSYEGKPNHLLVRYETLTENPEACLRQIFTFIGLPFSPAVQRDYRQAAARVTAPGEIWKKSVGGSIEPAHHKFVQLFSPERQAYILARTRPYKRPSN